MQDDAEQHRKPAHGIKIVPSGDALKLDLSPAFKIGHMDADLFIRLPNCIVAMGPLWIVHR